MSTPRYSIILAARNEGDYVRRTVEDILEHSPVARTELVIVDDASDDRSCDFLSGAGVAEAPLHVVRNDERRGLIFSRARGADLARGEHLVFLDAHSAVTEGWLPEMERRLAAADGRGIVVPLIYRLEPEAWCLDRRNPAASGCSIVTPFLDFNWTEPIEVDGKLCTCTIGGGAWMCRRDWYAHIGGLDRGMVYWGGDNVDIPLRTWASGGFCLVADGVAVGHLFKTTMANPTRGVTITFNKIRAAHTVFTRETFDRVMHSLAHLEGFEEALERIHAEREEIGHIKGHLEGIRRRTDRWLIDTFGLPILEAPYLYAPPRRKRTEHPWRRRPLVSVIIPWTGGRKNVEPAVANVLETTAYGRYEILLCAGGEGNGEPGFPQRALYGGHPRLRVLSTSVPGQRGLLINLGACLSEAEYLAVMNIDIGEDVVIRDEHWVERFILLFERRPRLLLASPRLEMSGAEDRGDPGGRDLFDLVWDWKAPGLAKEREGEPLRPGPYQALAVPEALLFIRRTSLQAVGGFDPTLHDGRALVLDLAVNAWLSGHEVFCHPGITVAWHQQGKARRRPVAPGAAPADEYLRLLVALKYFTNRKRLERCRECHPRTEPLLQRHAVHIEECRREFLRRARYDEDWLFYKFNTETEEDLPDDASTFPPPGPDRDGAEGHLPG